MSNWLELGAQIQRKIADGPPPGGRRISGCRAAGRASF